MHQQSMQRFQSENGKIQLICQSDTALGDLHDFLMAIKGDIVERMVKAQKNEEEIAQKQKEQQDEPEADSCPTEG